LTADDLWDVSRRGTAELYIDWGGYRVSLELPIDPDEAYCSGQEGHQGKKGVGANGLSIKSRPSLDRLLPEPLILDPRMDSSASNEGYNLDSAWSRH
jgi:hypothetical protein